jgi:hypothetical protein
MQVYLTVLPRNNNDRKTIQRSVAQILQLHEELLAQLQNFRPKQDTSHIAGSSRPRRIMSKHIRWHSLETSPPRSFFTHRKERWARHSIDTSRPSLIQPRPFMADTKLVMDVAKVFDNFVCLPLNYSCRLQELNAPDATISRIRSICRL